MTSHILPNTGETCSGWLSFNFPQTCRFLLTNPRLLVTSPFQGVLVDQILSIKLQAGSPPMWLTSGVHGNEPLSSPLPKKVQSPFLSLFSRLSCLEPHYLLPYQSLHSSHSREFMETTLKLLSTGLKWAGSPLNPFPCGWSGQAFSQLPPKESSPSGSSFQLFLKVVGGDYNANRSRFTIS